MSRNRIDYAQRMQELMLRIRLPTNVQIFYALRVIPS